MGLELDIVHDVTRRLDALHLPFMLTGSMAMSYYAQPRMTRDIDVVVEVGDADVPGLMAAFQSDYYIDADRVREAIRHRSMFNVIHQASAFKIDFVIRKADEYRRLEFNRRPRVRIDHFETWIVSPEELILSKLVWSRQSRSEMQIRDVRSLLSTPLDATYLEEWAVKLGVASFLEECRHA